MICLLASSEFSNYLLFTAGISCIFLLIVVTVMDWRIYLRIYNYIKDVEVKRHVIELKDYYDLKYRLNLLVSVSALVLAIAGYLGYDLNRFISLKATEIDNYESRIASTEQRLSLLDSSLQRKVLTVDNFDSRIKSLWSEVNNISLDNLKAAKTYLIERIKIKLITRFDTHEISITEHLKKNGIFINQNDRVQAIITNSYPTNNILVSNMEADGKIIISFDQYYLYGMSWVQYAGKMGLPGNFETMNRDLYEIDKKINNLGIVSVDILVIVTPEN